MKAPQDTVILFGRSMRHIQRSPDTIITVAIVPIMLMLLFVYVFGGAIHAGTDDYVGYLLRGILLIATASGISYTPVRIFNDPADRDRRPTAFYARGPVIGAVGARDDLAGVQRDHAGLGHPDRPADGLPDRRRPGRLARRGRHPGAVHPALTWLAVIPGLTAKSIEGASPFAYPLIFLPFISSAFVPTDTMPTPVRVFAENQPVTAIVETLRDLSTGQPVGADTWTALGWCVGITIVAYLLAMRAYKRSSDQAPDSPSAARTRLHSRPATVG